MTHKRRIFDITISIFLLLLFSPLILLIVVLMPLESAGPVLCYSYRVGSEFHIFKFYRFRTMKKDYYGILGCKQQANLSLASKVKPLNNQEIFEQNPRKVLIGDTGGFLEKDYKLSIKDNQEHHLNAEKLTRIGSLIFKFHLGWIPQLINILIGDMSFFENAPLTLKEAEKLTDDKSISTLMNTFNHELSRSEVEFTEDVEYSFGAKSYFNEYYFLLN